MAKLFEVECADASDEGTANSAFIGSDADLLASAALVDDPSQFAVSSGQNRMLESFLGRLGSLVLHYSPGFVDSKLVGMAIFTMLCRSVGPFWLKVVSALAMVYFEPLSKDAQRASAP